MPGADHDTQPGCAGAADRALRVIAAQQHADAVIARVRAGQLDAEGLALEVAPLYGLGLQALCRAVCRAIAPRLECEDPR